MRRAIYVAYKGDRDDTDLITKVFEVQAKAEDFLEKFFAFTKWLEEEGWRIGGISFEYDDWPKRR